MLTWSSKALYPLSTTVSIDTASVELLLIQLLSVLVYNLREYFTGLKKKENLELVDMIKSAPIFHGLIPATSIVGVLHSFGTYGPIEDGRALNASFNLYGILVLAVPK